MIKSTFSLPEVYERRLRVDMQKDRKCFFLINVLGLMIMAVMAAFGIYVGPPFGVTWQQLLIVCGGIVIYMVAHEAVHGVFIRLYSGKWGRFGFTGAFAYAGSDAYFSKIPYAIIALSPVVVWGAVFAIACALFPHLFWPVYLLQIVNLSGAAGDFYVCYLLFHMPERVLVRDDGTAMEFFAPHESVERKIDA